MKSRRLPALLLLAIPAAAIALGFEAAQRGGTPQPGAGNAYSITIAPDGAVIRDAVLEAAPSED